VYPFLSAALTSAPSLMIFLVSFKSFLDVAFDRLPPHPATIPGRDKLSQKWSLRSEPL